MDINQAGIPLGWHMLPKMDSVGSTNTWLKEHAADLPSHSVLIAREQHAGRGRNGRAFHSAKDHGLYLSILLKQTFSCEQLGRLTALNALALQRAILESCGLNTQIKWVNDLVIQTRKLAGILCETCRQQDTLQSTIIGFGVNVFSQSFPYMEDNQPAAIADFSMVAPSMDTLTSALLRHVEDCLSHLDDPSYMQAYRNCSCVIGRKIRVSDGHGRYDAFAEDIDEQGRLIIRHGEARTVLCCGEVSIRPLR